LITIPSLFPIFKLTFFAPFFIIAYYKKPLISCLWMAFFCGLIMDIFSPPQRLGTYALNYCMTTLILYSQKQNFFEDSYTTLPVMTFLFALLSTILQTAMLEILGLGLPLSFSWALTDLLVMPSFDSLYAFFFFAIFMPRASHREYFF
jgi:rod shape-determining protein MreD